MDIVWLAGIAAMWLAMAGAVAFLGRLDQPREEHP
ncbi:MAG: hypothetical protein GAK38_01598 [Xylophilus sp.]|nr:MAG: hypothetical protein GAK38_01598 [Xylophilus sp.]